MIKFISLMASVAAIGITPADAAPAPKPNATLAENIAYSNRLCGDVEAMRQLGADFSTLSKMRLPTLSQRINADKMAVADFHSISTKGFPNGFALKDGQVDNVACSAQIAMRINGKTVEYRDLNYRVDLYPGNTVQIVTTDRGTTAEFIEHVFIDNEPLSPGKGKSDMIAASQDQSIELMEMADAGMHGPFTPEMLAEWRVRRLELLLGPLRVPSVRETSKER